MSSAPASILHTKTINLESPAPSPDRPSAHLFERLVGVLDSLRSRLDDLKRREQTQLATIQRLEGQLREAGEMQRAFLPDRLPDIEGLNIEVLYRPADHVSGDIYDVHRLDDSHVAFAIADATGHGLGAALLSALIRRSLRGSERTDSTSRLLEPDEVLHRMNDEILQVGLPDCQFVAAMYAVYDERSGMIHWARGGAPYPVLIRKGEPITQLKSEGPLVGTIDKPSFEIVRLKLEPGDRLYFFSDGVEDIIDLPGTQRSVGNHSESGSSRSRPLDPFEQLESAVTHNDQISDDVTALMIQAVPNQASRGVEAKSAPTTGLIYSDTTPEEQPAKASFISK